MDSNSNSMEPIPWLKVETDDSNSPKRDNKLHWSSENTRKLIEIMERECKELWDVKNPLIKDRKARQSKLEYLADFFGTTSEEISRKIHNLRSQFNNELRKIKKRQGPGGEGSPAGAGGSGWEYFDALSFLQRVPTSGDPLSTMDTIEGVNLALAEFQAEEEAEFGAAAARSRNEGSSEPVVSRPRIRVAASAPPPLPPSAHPMMWPEQPQPRLRPGHNADECQIFGDFVASELRTLRSDESRKRLKRIIQKAILQIEEEEDVNIITG